MLQPVGEPLPELRDLWRDHHAAVAGAGMQREVVVVLGLGRIELRQRRDLGDDAVVPDAAGADLGGDRLGGPPLGVGGGEDHRTVLGADGGTLPVRRGRVVDGVEHPQQVGVGQHGRVEGDADHLGMAGAAGADLLVGRVRGAAAGIARQHVGDAVEVAVDRLQAPEAAAAEHGRLKNRGGGWNGVRHGCSFRGAARRWRCGGGPATPPRRTASDGASATARLLRG